MATAVVVGVVATGDSTTTAVSGAAPSFRLASTAGGQVALSDFRGKNVLLYFNEGVGCDVCFVQTAKLEADGALAKAGVTLLPIVMNPTAQLQPQLARFGISTPYLSDPSGDTSRQFRAIGGGHHADLPGHTFILVGPDGTLRWRGDYPGMWVEPADLATAVQRNLG